MVVHRQKWLSLGKVVVVRQSGCFLEKEFFFRTKVDVLVQSDCFMAKVVVFGQKWMYS